MKITCPHCKTTYNLSDDKVRPGVKLRCTVCRQVFAAPKGEASQESLADPKAADPVVSITIGKPDKPRKGKGGKKVYLFLLLLILLGGAAAGAWRYTDWLDPVKAMLAESRKQNEPGVVETDDERAARIASMVSKLQIQNIRQYTVKNEKIGNIVVIEGKIANGFDEARELIRVEAALQDEMGNTLVSKSRLAGPTISLFQLQVLSEAELEQGLSNKLDILTNNTNIAPGGSVPFMVVFYGAPEKASRFNVTVIDADKPKTEKK